MSDDAALLGVPTPILGLTKPAVGADIDIWGDLTNANWDILDKALLTTGGLLTGSIAISRPLPPLINNAAVVCGQAVAGSFTYNAYLDSGGAWHYRAANTALYFGSVGGITGIAAAVAGAQDAPLTWGPASVVDARGNFGIGMVPPAGQATAGGVGGWLFGWGVTAQNLGANVYYGSDANWHYLALGAAVLCSMGGGGWSWLAAPSGAAGAVAAMSQAMVLDLSGNLAVTAGVTAGSVRSHSNVIADTGVYAAFAVAANYVMFGDASNLHLQFEAGYRWQYTRSSGQLYWVSNNAVVFGIEPSGTINAIAGGRSICPTAANSYLTICGSTAFAGGADFIINGGGRATYAFEYYWGNVRIGTLDQNGNLANTGSYNSGLNITAAGYVMAVGPLYARNGASYLASGGNGVVMQFSPSWYFDWNATNGTLTWISPASACIWWDGSGNSTQIGGCYATAYPGPSDARLKKNVQPWAERGLADVILLEPVSFEFNGEGGLMDDGVTRYGVIAQDAQQCLPEAIHIMPPPAHPAETASTEIADRLAFDNGTLVFAMVNAIKEISARLVALENAAGIA